MLRGMSEAKVPCSNYREAIILLDAVKAYAELGEYFEAGVWWREVYRPLGLIRERELQSDIQRRMTSVSEEVCAAQRQALVRARCGQVQGLRDSGAEGSAELLVGLPHGGRCDDRHVLDGVPLKAGASGTQAPSGAARRIAG
jgi:hypothetical protein